MTKREECIEAMEQAIADNIEGWTPEQAHYPATAAFDAALAIMLKAEPVGDPDYFQRQYGALATRQTTQ